MTISADFTVNGNPNPAAHSVSYGATVALALTSLGNADTITWTLESISQSGEVTPTITPAGSPLGATASFVMVSNPGDGLGRTVLVKCVVTGANGARSVHHGVVGVANGAGFIPVPPGEENYRDATHGWINELNAALAGVTPGAVTSGASLVAAKAMAVANVTLSGAQTLDGISCVASDRVFLAFQSSASQNGPWLVASGAWTRPSDFNTSAEVISGQTIVVTQGVLYGGTQWALTTQGPFTLGTTALVWARLGGSESSGSLFVKEPLTVVATSAITLSGLAQTIDGIAINSTTMRVLATAQASGATNGIYNPRSGAWVRAADFDVSGDALPGCSGQILLGTVYGGGRWALATNGTITLGTTALSFDVEPFIDLAGADGVALTVATGVPSLTKIGTAHVAAGGLAPTRIAPGTEAFVLKTVAGVATWTEDTGSLASNETVIATVTADQPLNLSTGVTTRLHTVGTRWTDQIWATFRVSSVDYTWFGTLNGRTALDGTTTLEKPTWYELDATPGWFELVTISGGYAPRFTAYTATSTKCTLAIKPVNEGPL